MEDRNMSKQESIEMFKMTSFDQVQQIAGFTYISESNQVKTIAVSHMIFKELMSDKPWDQKKFGQILAPQFDLRTCLRSHGKDIQDWDQWFEEKSKNLIKENAAIRAR
jgi:hypothetical protein